MKLINIIYANNKLEHEFQECIQTNRYQDLRSPKEDRIDPGEAERSVPGARKPPPEDPEINTVARPELHGKWKDLPIILEKDNNKWIRLRISREQVPDEFKIEEPIEKKCRYGSSEER